MIRVYIETRKDKPWQHEVGERCAARLKGMPMLPNDWGRRKPVKQKLLERFGMHLEEVEPDRDSSGLGVDR